jgi:hypothetical protein
MRAGPVRATVAALLREGDAAMPRYRVRFLKTLADSSGHARACLQRSFDVDAAGPEAAVTNAQEAFCSLMQISDCRFYADIFDVERVEFERTTERPVTPAS